LFELVGDPATNRSEKQSYIKLQCKVNSWATLPSCILMLDWNPGGMPSSASAKINFHSLSPKSEKKQKLIPLFH